METKIARPRKQDMYIRAKPLEQANLPSWKKVLAQTDTEPEVLEPEKIMDTKGDRKVKNWLPIKLSGRPVSSSITAGMVSRRRTRNAATRSARA